MLFEQAGFDPGLRFIERGDAGPALALGKVDLHLNLVDDGEFPAAKEPLLEKLTLLETG
jgi:hypothetical protein